MIILRLIAWIIEQPLARWAMEAALLIVFEKYAVPWFAKDLPEAGLVFGILLSAVVVLFEITSHQGRVLKRETERVLRAFDHFTRHGGLSKIEQSIVDTDNHNKLVSSLILRSVPPRNKGSQYFSVYYQDTMRKLVDIVHGRFTFRSESPEQIWRSHIYSLDRASRDILFRATCLVPRTAAGMQSVFDNDTYNQYCQHSYKKLKDGQISEMKKIFIIDDLSVIRENDASCLINHLLEIGRLAKSIPGGKLKARVMIVNTLRRQGDLNEIPEDFMIWGEELVVTSKMEESHLLFGLECSTHENDISKMIEEFERLFNLSTPLDDFIKWNRL